jgi:phytoene dehydrogenase-like protein
VPGLFLASAFAQPGGGFTGAMLAGQNAFQAASKKAW